MTARRKLLVPIIATVLAVGAGFAVADGKSYSGAPAGSSHDRGPGGPPPGMAAPPGGSAPRSR